MMSFLNARFDLSRVGSRLVSAAALAKLRADEAARLAVRISYPSPGANGVTAGRAEQRDTMRPPAWRDQHGTEFDRARSLGHTVRERGMPSARHAAADRSSR